MYLLPHHTYFYYVFPSVQVDTTCFCQCRNYLTLIFKCFCCHICIYRNFHLSYVHLFQVQAEVCLLPAAKDLCVERSAYFKFDSHLRPPFSFAISAALLNCSSISSDYYLTWCIIICRNCYTSNFLYGLLT